MSKPGKAIIALVIIILVLGAAIIINWPKNIKSPQLALINPETQVTSLNNNEPHLDFIPSYHENRVTLSNIPNYSALKLKYGLNLSPAQEKSLESNRFLLLPLENSPFFKTSQNFDQWLVDSDSMGGGNIYNRKAEDTVLATPDLVLHTYHKYFELTLEQLEHELGIAPKKTH